MNFDNLMHYDLMTGLYRFIPSLLIFLFWHWPCSLHCVIQCVKEFRIHSVEKVSEVSPKSNVKSWLTWNEKRDQKVKRKKKHSRTSPDVQFKEFSLNNKKIDLKRTKSELENKKKNRKSMSKWRRWTKNHQLNFPSNKKLDLEWTMIGLGKPFRKSDPKKSKKH